MRSVRRLVGASAVALTMLASACSSSDNNAPPQLSGSGNQPVTEADPVTGTTAFYMPADSQPTLAPGADPAQAAIGYLQANGAALGIPDAQSSYKAIDSSKDDTDGTTHVKLQQVSNGIDVWGVVTTVHFDDSGFVDIVDGPFIPNLDAVSKQIPVISDAAGRATAQTESLTLTGGALGATVALASLVIYVEDDYSNPRLARHYRTSLWTSESVESGEVFVDAMNGAVIASWNDSSNVDSQETAFTTDYDGVTRTTPVIATGGIFRHGRLQTTTQSQLVPGKWVGTGQKATWVNFDHPTLQGPWDPQAVTVMVNIERTERFYMGALSWEGPSNKRSNVFVAVRDPLESGYVNSFAYKSPDGTQDTLTFTKAGTHGERSPVVGIDIVGHEWTHLVTAYNSKLVYRTEPGAINEALSDIFGCFVERTVTGVHPNTYLIGEAKGEPWRDMRHPTYAVECPKCVDNYEKVHLLPKGVKPNNDGTSKGYNDSGYVHTNSSIVNNAWALMVDGGTNDTSKMNVASGIGWDKSIGWWWKAQRHLLTPRMGIRRLARLQSALSTKSKGRYDPKVIACAWAATGGIDVAWASNKLHVDCTSSGAGGITFAPDKCSTKADGTYCDHPDDIFGYICKGKVTAESLICPPPNTHCIGATPDGKTLICTN